MFRIRLSRHMLKRKKKNNLLSNIKKGFMTGPFFYYQFLVEEIIIALPIN